MAGQEMTRMSMPLFTFAEGAIGCANTRGKSAKGDNGMSYKPVSLLTGIVFVGATAWATAALAAPWVFTAWKKTALNQTECVRRGTALLNSNGYSNVKSGINGSNTVVGGIGDYTGLVRCAAGDLGVVFFVVAGPTNLVSNYLTNLYDGF
jgi:hypothetical protein